MKTQVQDRSGAMDQLLAEARAEADQFRKRLEKLEKILLSTRLIMGHELKKPTTAVMGYIDLALEDIDEKQSPQLAEHVRKARGECGLLSELNQFFLELLKVEGRPQIIHGGEVTIRGFLEETLLHMRPELKARERVKTRISPDVQKFRINPSAFKVILTNVIENALQYSRGDVLVKIYKQPDKRGMGGGYLLRIEVSDEGCGIPSKYLKKIFRAFVRLHADEVEGSGLGLTLVRSLTELNGGHVHIRSNEGKGTTVVVTLPEIDDKEEDEDEI